MTRGFSAWSAPAKAHQSNSNNEMVFVLVITSGFMSNVVFVVGFTSNKSLAERVAPDWLPSFAAQVSKGNPNFANYCAGARLTKFAASSLLPLPLYFAICG